MTEISAALSSDPPRIAGMRPRAPRRNLLLSANIEACGCRAPVRIRNLSEGGAMIDGAVLPGVGTPLILRRMELEIGGTTVWQGQGRCGIKFDGTTTIDEWVTGTRRPLMGQARVDAIQAAIRSGDSLPMPDGPSAGMLADPGLLDGRMAEELAYVGRLLDSVGDELTDDPIILQRHDRSLQKFDAACQIVAHLAAIIGAEDRVGAVNAVTMEEMRSRLLRK